MNRARTVTTAADTTVWVNGRAVPVPDGSAGTGDGPRIVLRFTGPIARRWSGAIARAGGDIAFWCPPFGACVTLTRPDGAAAIAALPFVAGFVPFSQELCDRDIGEREPVPAPGLERSPRWLDVICFSAAERPAVARSLHALGAQVLDQAHSKIRIAWAGDLAAIRDVVGVKLVERPRIPRPSSAGVTTGLATAIGDDTATGDWNPALDGRREIIAVADTGLDTGAAASIGAGLAGRVAHIVSWPINPSWAPFVGNPGADDGAADRSSGHGTYVTGVAAGDGGARAGAGGGGAGAGAGGGGAGAGAHRGVAPGCRIVFQAMEQYVQVSPGHPELGASGYQLAGRPTDLRDLFDKAREFGARVQLNAWGTVAHARYDNDCYEADLYLSEHPDTVLLFAAGNEGSDADGNRRIDPGSLESPAVAKNVLTVGATEGSQLVGFTGTWASLQGQGRVYGNPADRADPVAGQPDRMALLSSAGPTYDGRIKPDICAPGTDVVGPRSSLATGTGWGLLPGDGRYMVDGGTSAAVAVAGGAVALIRQAWRQARGRAPAGATTKALTILGAAPVRTRDGTGVEDRFVAGFGRIDVTASLPTTPSGEAVLILSDSTVAGAARTGRSRSFTVTVRQSGPLRAVLCWYDPPGEHLVSNLDLSITGSGLPAPVWGNHPPGQVGFPDLLNTVEVIDLDAVPAGSYQLVVAGANVPSGRQPFSLVVRGRAITPSR